MAEVLSVEDRDRHSHGQEGQSPTDEQMGIIIGGINNGKFYRLKIDSSGNISVINTNLPTGAATSAKQLPDNHQVTVSNPTANPETGLAKDTTLTGGTQQTKVKETVPTDSTKLNPSLVLSYTGSNLTTIQKTIGVVTYTKTLSYDGSNNLTGVSVWS